MKIIVWQYNRENLFFLSIMIITFIIGFDTTALGIAIPNIATDIRFSIKQGSWLSVSYTAGFAALLLPAGIITDKVGYYLVLIGSILVFMVMSFYLTLCGSLESFTIIRFMQGISASFLNTSALSLLNILYPIGISKNRKNAFNHWSAVLGLSFALGPILGSLIIIYLSWKWIMLINIPLGVVVLIPFIGKTLKNNILSLSKLRKVSLLSAIPMSCILLFLTMYKYIYNIFDIYLLLVLCGLCFILLIFFHITINNSFTRLPDLKKYSFIIVMILPVIFSISYWSLFIVLPQYFTLRFGLTLYTIMCLMFLLSIPLTLIPIFNVAQKFHLNTILGFLFLTCGLLLLSFVFYKLDDFHLIISGFALLLLGTGAAILNPFMARVVMDNVQAQNSGLASAIASTLRQAGFAVGVTLFSLLTDNKSNIKFYFTESEVLLFISFLPMIAIVIYIFLNKNSKLLLR